MTLKKNLKTVAKIKFAGEEIKVRRWIEDLLEEEHYRELEDKIAQYERDKQECEQYYFYKMYGH